MGVELRIQDLGLGKEASPLGIQVEGLGFRD